MSQFASFSERLEAAIRTKKTPALVGLDPRLQDIPSPLTQGMDSRDFPRAAGVYSQFCRGIIDVVAPLVPAVKPQAAFFEQLGPPGMQALFEVMEHARQAGLLVLLDGKRNDIGSTAAGYAEAYLSRTGPWRADALTEARRRLEAPETTPSARVLATIERDFGGSFRGFALAQSEQAQRQLRNLPLDAATSGRFQRMAHDSILEQRRREATDMLPFETYRERYLAADQLEPLRQG